MVQYSSPRQRYLTLFYENPQAYLDAIAEDNEKIKAVPLTLIFSSVFAGVTQGLVLGLAAFAVGAAQLLIAELSRPGNPREDAKRANTYSGALATRLARPGQTIPAIFTSASLDPTGGFRTGGDMIYYKIITYNGSQSVKARYVISHGQIGSVDLMATTLNEQPVSQIDSRLYNLTWHDGNDLQISDPRFEEYCQHIAIANNNGCGVGLISESISLEAPSLTDIKVSGDEFEAYPPTRQYLALSGDKLSQSLFLVSNKNKIVSGMIETYLITASTPFAFNPAHIFYYEIAYYQTTRRVTSMDLTMALLIDARNDRGEELQFGCLYTLFIRPYSSSSYVGVCHFLVKSYSHVRIFRQLSVTNLAFNIYKLEIRPVAHLAAPALPVYDLLDIGVINNYPSAFDIGGGVFPTISGQITINTMSVDDINRSISQYKADRPTNSAQQGPTLILTGVNEIESATASPVAKDFSLKGLATVELELTLSAQLNGQVDASFFVTEGIITKALLASATADAGSTPTSLNYLPGHGVVVTAPGGVYLRNLSKRIEGEVQTTTATTINTAVNLQWETGDKWLVYDTHSSCWWPEIYEHLTADPKFGLTGKIAADYYNDYPNLVDSTRWVEGTNEHNQFFAWHGVFNQAQRLSQINAENSPKVLLKSWRGGGNRMGFEPERTPINMPNPVIFNTSNCKGIREVFTTASLDAPTQVVYTYLHKEARIPLEQAIVFNEVSLSAESHDAVLGLVPPRISSVQNNNCTSEAQAITASRILLNLARYGGRNGCTFDSIAIESATVRLAHAFRLVTAHTAYDGQLDGVVVDATTTEFRLDKDPVILSGITSAVFAGGLIDTKVDFVANGVEVGDLVRNQETGSVSPIAAVTSTTLDCLPSIGADVQYEILNLTPSNLRLSVGGAVPQGARPFTAQYIDGHVWLTVMGVQPDILDPVVITRIGEDDRLYQSVSQIVALGQPNDQGVADYRVTIAGTNWTPKFYDYSDVEVRTRSSLINPA